VGDSWRETPAEHGPVRAILAARLLAALFLLGSAIVVRLHTPAALGSDALFLLLALTFGLTAISAALLRLAPRHPRLVDAQLAADAVVVSVAVLLTGGRESLLVPLYVLPVVGAAVANRSRGGLLVAILNILLYGAIVAVQSGAFGGSLPARLGLPGPLTPMREAFVTLALNGAGFVCVGWLAGYLGERVRRSDERLRHASTVIADLRAFNECVIQSLTGGLVTADPAGRILTFNTAAEQITGWRRDEARGRLAADVLQLPPGLVDDLPALGTSGRGRRLELGYRTAAGREVDLGLTAAPLRVGEGRAGLLFTFQDITERKRHEREAQTEKRLAAIGEMAAGIAHEIRNPLASIAGSVQVLRADLALTPEQARLLDIVVRESQRLDETIRSFLSYARPPRAVSGPVDLGRVVTDAAALLENRPEYASRLRIVASPGPGGCVIRADENQVRQVVWNLATNGLKAMPGRGTLTLAVERAGAGRVALSVRDEGIGIAARDLDRVFEPFRTGFAGGVGLGLSIVHRIVTDAGGSIDVDSAPGAGTTVRVSWPAADDMEAAPRAALSA
jgi:two-component system sensor histidine kinase PilS (NtrC family)